MPVEMQPTGMPPEQAMQILQRLGIDSKTLPIVMQAIQTVIGAQGGQGAVPPGDSLMSQARQAAASPAGLPGGRQQY